MKAKNRYGVLSLLLYVFFCQTSLAQPSNKEIDSLVKAYVSMRKFNGNALVYHQGKIIYQKSYGYSDKEHNRLVTKEQIFQIGSLTKPFTAILVLKLAEKKLLSLDDPVSKFIKDYPGGHKITIRHLITHTSGLYEVLRNPLYFEGITSTKKYSHTEKLRYFQHEPLDFEPGTQFAYSNSGYSLLGIIIEQVSGKTYSECLKQYIKQPLKMHNTGFDYRLVKKNKTTGYSYLSDTKVQKAPYWNADLLFSTGAIYSNLEDLLKFYKGIKNFTIISEENLTPATRANRGGYGFGFYIDSVGTDRVVNHGGNLEGFTSYFAASFEKDICIILLNNITSTALEKLGNTIYKIVTNQPYTFPAPKKPIEISKDILLTYVGVYEVSPEYMARVEFENGGLFLQINREQKLMLKGETETSFFIDGEDMVVDFISVDNIVSAIKIRQGLATKVGDKIHQ
jgi:CubicO group peptidase (beta-lactamase class C family)